MAKPIVLCADSTCDLGAELIERYNVKISPMHVHLGEEMYADGVDITPDDIYAVYREKKILPTTSATNMEEYKDFVNPFIEAGNDVLFISLGSGISTTYNNARLAGEEIPGMYVINSGNVITATANILLGRGEEKLRGVGVGDGPIDAAFLAIEQIIGHHYELDDFQIQTVTEGRDAMGSALVKLRANGRVYSGNGISTDIIGASIRAYISALNKIVYEEA
jgi:hypothetical protein